MSDTKGFATKFLSSNSLEADLKKISCNSLCRAIGLLFNEEIPKDFQIRRDGQDIKRVFDYFFSLRAGKSDPGLNVCLPVSLTKVDLNFSD